MCRMCKTSPAGNRRLLLRCSSSSKHRRCSNTWGEAVVLQVQLQQAVLASGVAQEVIISQSRSGLHLMSHHEVEPRPLERVDGVAGRPLHTLYSPRMLPS